VVAVLVTLKLGSTLNVEMLWLRNNIIVTSQKQNVSIEYIVKSSKIKINIKIKNKKIRRKNNSKQILNIKNLSMI